MIFSGICAGFFTICAMTFGEMSRRALIGSSSREDLHTRGRLLRRARRCLEAAVICGSVSLGFIVAQVEVPLLGAKQTAVGAIAARHAVATTVATRSTAEPTVPFMIRPMNITQVAEVRVTHAQPAETTREVEHPKSRIADVDNPNTVLLHTPGNRRVQLRDEPVGGLVAQLSDLTQALPLGPQALDEEGIKWVKVRTLGGLEGWVMNTAITRKPPVDLDRTQIASRHVIRSAL